MLGVEVVLPDVVVTVPPDTTRVTETVFAWFPPILMLTVPL
jgi:hypothetical protein